MRKILRFSIFFFMMAVGLSWTKAYADESELYLGYCEGQINGVDDVKGASFGLSGSGEVNAAIVISKKELLSLAGNSITAIRVGFSNVTLPTEVSVWIKEGSYTSTTVVASGTGVPTKAAWTTIALEQPYAITGETDLTIGFSYIQKTKLNAISLAGETDIANSAWVGKTGGTWSDKSKTGCLAIEAVVKGDYLPKKNLLLYECSLSRESLRAGSKLEVSGTVKNPATQTIEGYRVNYSFEGTDQKGYFDFSDSMPYRGKSTFNVAVPTEGLAAGAYKLNIKISLPNGEQDENGDDDMSTFTVALYDNGYEQNLLLEEFTTENCGNCPSAVSRIKAAIKGIEDNVIWVCHHNGYGTDAFTHDSSKKYIWFYTGGGTYAPAAMLNRTYSERWCDDPTPVFFPAESTFLANTFNYILSDISSAMVSVEPSLDGSSLSLTIKGECTDMLNQIYGTTRLTVYVIEDEVTPVSQGGAPAGYKHEGVVRECLSDVWGDVINWTDNKFEASYTLNLSSAWNVNNLSAVAFINEYNATDRKKCRVVNSGKAKVQNNAAGIDNVATDSIEQVYYTSLDGKRIQNVPAHGIFIKTVVMSNGNKVNSKVVR